MKLKDLPMNHFYYNEAQELCFKEEVKETDNLLGGQSDDPRPTYFTVQILDFKGEWKGGCQTDGDNEDQITQVELVKINQERFVLTIIHLFENGQDHVRGPFGSRVEAAKIWESDYPTTHWVCEILELR